MARKYPMTVDEIVTSYRQARNRQTQIGVLADLNVCTRKEIRELLAEAGVLSPPAPETAKKGGRPISFDAELARRLWAEGLTDAEIAEKLGIPVERLVRWRQRVGLLRPRVPPQCRQDENGNKRPAEAGRTQEEQTMKKQSMDVRTPSAAEAGIVTVKTLRALLDAAEASGYGDAPLEVKGCRFAEMHLRVETLIGADVPGTLVELMATPVET